MGLGAFMTALQNGFTSFRATMLNADPQQQTAATYFDEWNRYDSRRFRYDLNWALFQNNAFDEKLHPSWAKMIKGDKGIYKHSRNILSFCSRLGSFYGERLWGGLLDHKAGDGESVFSALPIITENESTRTAIAKLWRDSRWSERKGVGAEYGAVLGDVALVARDDPEKRRVVIDVVHPGSFSWVQRDPRNRDVITGYVRVEQRYDPTESKLGTSLSAVRIDGQIHRVCRYSEMCYLEDDHLVYQTFKDGQPYDWTGYGSDPYEVDLPFIPLRFVQHRNIGLPWGLNCFHTGYSRSMELDDQASGLSDQVRKSIRGPFLMSGMSKPKSAVDASGNPTMATDTLGHLTDVADRDEIGFLYANKDARAQSLVVPLDMIGTVAYIKMLIDDSEKNFPELIADAGTTNGDGSGRAIKEARKRATSIIYARRPAYDEALTEIQSMAIAIGGYRGYQGYSGYSIESIINGDLDHSIGHRPVFDVDPSDQLDEEKVKTEILNGRIKAGIPLRIALKLEGWSEVELDELEKEKKKEINQALAIAGTQGDVHTPTQLVMDGASAKDNKTPQTPPSQSEPAARSKAQDHNQGKI